MVPIRLCDRTILRDAVRSDEKHAMIGYIWFRGMGKGTSEKGLWN